MLEFVVVVVEDFELVEYFEVDGEDFVVFVLFFDFEDGYYC